MSDISKLVCSAQEIPGLPSDSCGCRCHRSTMRRRENRIYRSDGHGYQCRSCGFRTITPVEPGEVIRPETWLEYAGEVLKSLVWSLVTAVNRLRPPRCGSCRIRTQLAASRGVLWRRGICGSCLWTSLDPEGSEVDR